MQRSVIEQRIGTEGMWETVMQRRLETTGAEEMWETVMQRRLETTKRISTKTKLVMTLKVTFRILGFRSCIFIFFIGTIITGRVLQL